MANNIVLKTYKGKSVTPQDDAIIYETAIPQNGVFKGCNVSYARGNVLRVSQGFGMIKGRFFEVYESEVDVRLADGDATLQGRIYIHMDLSNTDEPIQILTQTGAELPDLQTDEDVNYNNTSYDLELAVFKVTSSELSKLEMTFEKITSGSGGGGGTTGAKENVSRNTEYSVGDMTRAATAPGWVTLVCIEAGVSALTVPSGYAKIAKAGDTVTDGTCVFKSYNLPADVDDLKTSVSALDEEVESIKASLGNTGGLQTVVCSVSAYAEMEGWDDNTIYLCYEDADPSKITRIYKGESRIFSNTVQVTYQSDTGVSTSKTLMDKDDAIAVAPAVTKEDYTFVGWRADSEAKGDVLSEYVIDQETAVTLYAVFKKSIEIMMYPNGGALAEGKTESTLTDVCYYNNGTSLSAGVEMPVSPYVLKDQSFIGWSYGTSLFKPGEKGQFTDSGVILASWIDTVYDFLKPGTVVFRIPADGIYEFETFGAEGFAATYTASTSPTTKYEALGGKGGHAKGYIKMKKDDVLFVCNGAKPTYYGSGGSFGGSGGNSYSSNKTAGASAGGASYITKETNIIGASSSNQSTYYAKRDKIYLVAGGGGGGGIDYRTTTVICNEGGDGGGDRGEDGSGGALGGRQVSTGSLEYSGFGYGGTYSGSNNTYSGGGGGYFGGNYGTNGESGAGGSGYVGGMPPFTHNKKFYGPLNEAGVNDGDGYSYIRFVEVC